MPSFVVHSIAGQKLLNKINVSENDMKLFFICNLLPDAKNFKIDNTLCEKERRKQIQEHKNITHFRTELDNMLGYPNLELFLKKYKNRFDIGTLGYFFHLYLDHQFFKYFLPTYVTFYDKYGNKTLKKSEIFNIKVNERFMSEDIFFSKKNDKGLYKQYDILNNYLLNNNQLFFDKEELHKFLNDFQYEIIVEENNYKNSLAVVDKLFSLCDNKNQLGDKELSYFTKKDIENFIDESVNRFLLKYSYLINKL